MRGLWLAVLLSSVGCTEKAIELRLSWPDSGSDVANTDLSCVNSIHVMVQGEIFEDFTDTCIEISNPTSYEDIQAQIRGKLDANLPGNPVAIEVRGLAGAVTGACGSGMDIFYAGSNYTGEDLTLRVEGAIDCSALNPGGELTLRPIDFVALANTPAGADPVCTTLPATTVPTAYLGFVRPTNITYDQYPTSIMEYGDSAEPDMAGLLRFPAMGTPLPTSCLATAVDPPFNSTSCIYPGNARVCAGAGEIDLPMISGDDAFDSIDNDYFAEYPVIVHGIVYDTVARRPVAGATVTFAENRGAVAYTNARFEDSGGSATDASGVFIAYLREPSVASITEGPTTKSMRIGGASFGGSAVIVPLR